MSDAENRSGSFFVKIGIPFLTFFGGMLVQYYLAGRGWSQQEFATATTIAASEVAQKNAELKAWSEQVLRKYLNGQGDKAGKDLVLARDDLIVSRQIAEDICFFPKNAFGKPYAKFFMDDLDANPQKIAGQDARLLLFKAVADYRMVREQYEGVLGILRQSCGFLLKR